MKNKATDLSLVLNGQSDYVIIIPNKSNECNKYAAEELQFFIKECTGAILPIFYDRQIAVCSQNKIISLGFTDILKSQNLEFDYESLNGDGFYIKTKHKSIFINGANDRGILYGVYEFLEKYLGVKFISSDCTETPKTDELSLEEIDVKSVPDFRYRGVLIRATNRADADIAFYARSRQSHEFNYITSKHGGSIRWFKGINVAHNSLSYVPVDKYFKSESQKRENAQMYFIKEDVPYEICWTNGILDNGEIDQTLECSTIKAAIEQLKNFVKSDPDAEFYPFAQEDNPDGYCNCPNCTMLKEKYKQMGVVIRFVNVMTREVQKWIDQSEFKGKKLKVVIFSYTYTRNAPVYFDEKRKKFFPFDNSVIPNEHVWIRLAPLDANIYYTLSDPEQTTKRCITYLEEWKSVTNRLMIWFYGLDYHNCFMYAPTIQKMSNELKDFKKTNFDYVFMQLNHFEANDVASIMNHYVYSKMLWDIKKNPYKLRKEFITYYFGSANKIIQEIYEFMDYYYLQNELHSNKRFMLNTLEGIYHPIKYLEYILNQCEKGIELINESLYSEQEKAQYTKHIEQVKLTPLYMLLLHSDCYYSQNSEKKTQIISEFKRLCEKLNVERIGEKDYYNEWIKTFLENKKRKAFEGNYDA